MHSLAETLHVSYHISAETQRRLDAWSAALLVEPPHEPSRWHVQFRRYMRSITVAASTRIEGNPMSSPQVDALLAGETVMAPQQAQLENLNLNRALDVAMAFGVTESFQWQESTIRVLNSTVMHNLPDDRLGRYREEPVTVGPFLPPDHHIIPDLMRAFEEWLRDCQDHALVRAALLHMNLVAIHPFLDGNGRTARVASTLELVRSGVRAPELLSVETYLASHRDEYFEQLHRALGDSYQPDRHSASEWVEYYVRITTALLDIERRIDEAFPHDMYLLDDLLSRRHEPTEWMHILHMAAAYHIRTSEVADFFGRSLPWARSQLNRMVEAGWLRQEGRTRAAHWLASDMLRGLDLRVPALLEQLERGQHPTLGLEAA
jgi:Fic family protein